MKRGVMAVAVLLACVGCRDAGGPAPAPGVGPGSGSGSVEQELGSIESTVDSMESELAGD
ncbi:hypothetical protein [Actinokineospora bangkokensis]|uniref:Uncharacterized protein n=1 Tax=Actinokineospora bangkokensis TaxID=1193682 RepID=A0A1Q9LFQ4_9PSEU|nr:hypothetical protein [Actinokineospora bangkokensis]OLR90825.1 hypothetical protein BJP25_30120 [Actinokineospora bangkokensis]